MTTTTNDGPLAGDLGIEYLPVAQLLLDAENPRLPLELRSSADQTALAINMAEIFDALAVAKSIARFGFYPWEALVVIPEGDAYTVVEGNRRLTAVRGLLESSLREQFDNANAWHAIVEGASRPFPQTLPCVVVRDRRDATPALGYRHISGIKPWDPEMQARYVASLVDTDHWSFSEVAELTGQTKQWVQETYSTFKVFEEVEAIGIDTEPITAAYSLLTVTMGVPELRTRLGAVNSIPERGSAIAAPDKEGIEEVLSWVFGTADSEPVASESREIRTLGKVVGKPAGLKAIRDGLSLEEAKQRVEDAEYDPLDVIRRDLQKAEQSLQRVDLSAIEPDDEIRRLVDAILEQTQRLLNQVDSSEGE